MFQVSLILGKKKQEKNISSPCSWSKWLPPLSSSSFTTKYQSSILFSPSIFYLPVIQKVKCENESHSVVSDSLWPHGLYSPWNSPGQNTGVGSLSLLQGIFRTQVSRIAGRFFTSWATREAQEHWSGEPIPSPADLPDPRIEPGSPALQADSLPTELWGKPVIQKPPVIWLLPSPRPALHLTSFQKLSHLTTTHTFHQWQS